MTLEELARHYAAAAFDRWHTPGHKGRLHAQDITELPDPSFFPEDCVEQAERAAAAALGCRHLRFLTGGSSMGVKASIMAAGGPVITGTANHPSVAEGLELARQTAIYIENERQSGLPLPLSAEQVEKALLAHPEAAAVLVTSPDYYGQCAAADRLAKVVHAHGKLLLADGAHGAHFPVSADFFPNSFHACADICNLSAHKTLSAYTQSAYLCVNNDALLGRVNHALQLLGTTSPNYILFAQLELAAVSLPKQRHAYERLRGLCEHFRAVVPCLPNGDFTRLTVDAQALGMRGSALAERLAAARIMPERVEERYVIFIATPQDDADKFNRLIAAIGQAADTRTAT